MSRFGTEAENVDAAGGSEEPRTMSLMGGVVGGNDPGEVEGVDVTADQSAGILGQTTVLLLLVTLIAAGTLYGMRLTQGDMGVVTKDVETRIDQVLAKLSKPDRDGSNPLGKQALQNLFGDTDSIVAMFADDPTRQQVPIEYVKKNPFANPLVEQKKADTPGTNASADERAAEARRRQLQMEAAGYELQTVMQGRNPVAIINGQLIQSGQELGSFKVGKIDSLSVELMVDGETFKLEMDTRSDRGGRRRR